MELRAVVKPRWTPDDYRLRPKDHDPVLAEIICERISNGEMLPAICTADRDMPLPGTFLRWCELDPILNNEYIAARRRGAEINLDESVVASGLANIGQAMLVSRVLKEHSQLIDPARYGPRATLKLTEGENGDGGIDYRSEVRRKIEALAKRFGDDEAEAAKTEDSSSGE